MTNEQIESQLGKLVLTERKLTNEILRLISLAHERELYLMRGYGSLFDWLTQKYGYSEPAARRRISAALLLRAVPEAAQKMESGSVNLTTLAKAQSAIRAQEKVTGALSDEQKAEVVQNLEMKSLAQAELSLVELLPASAALARREVRKVVSVDESRLAMNLSHATFQDLERAKELLSHIFPEGASFADVVAYLAKDFLKRKDPRRHKEPMPKLKTFEEPAVKSKSREEAAPATHAAAVAAKRRVKSTGIPAHVRREVFRRDDGRCTYKDERTGRVCGSRHQVQPDHIYPKSLGGEDTVENLRCLCRRHNLFAAEITLGISVDRFRRAPRSL